MKTARDALRAMTQRIPTVNPPLHNAADLKRIAELEAELAMEKEEHAECDASVQGVVTRAEKAEAEVERLRAHLRWHDVCGTACPTTDYLEVERSVGRAFPIPRVNPSGEPLGGGGRESGDQGPGSVPGRPGRPAAANPAARKERDEG